MQIQLTEPSTNVIEEIERFLSQDPHTYKLKTEFLGQKPIKRGPQTGSIGNLVEGFGRGNQNLQKQNLEMEYLHD